MKEIFRLPPLCPASQEQARLQEDTFKDQNPLKPPLFHAKPGRLRAKLCACPANLRNEWLWQGRSHLSGHPELEGVSSSLSRLHPHPFSDCHGSKVTWTPCPKEEGETASPFQAAHWLMGTTLMKEVRGLQNAAPAHSLPSTREGYNRLQFSC